MEKKWTIKSSVICVLVIVSLVMFASCKKKVETDPEAGQDVQQTAVEENTKADDTDAVAEDDATTAADVDTQENNDAETAVLRDAFTTVTVKFSYDSSAIVDTEIQTLEEKAEWLRNNADATVTIEGHCDERGTTEYNLALGDRRAARVKNFLVNLGIDAERVTTVSYGEEKPAVTGNDDSAWAQNRRAQCIID